jgi:UDP-N-acetylglucosamine acyltransferase
VQVGAYSIIDEYVELGAGCKVHHHVYLTGHMTAGESNFFGVGSVIGSPPQDTKYKGAATLSGLVMAISFARWSRFTVPTLMQKIR